MARGFLAGMIWGTVLAGFGAAALSVAVGLPAEHAAKSPVAVMAKPMPSNGTDDAAPTAKSAPQVDPSKSAAVATGDNTDRTIDDSKDDVAASGPGPAKDVQTGAPLMAMPGPETGEPAAESAAAPELKAAADSVISRPDTPDQPVVAAEAPQQTGADTTAPSQPSVGDAPSAPESVESSARPQVAVTSDAPVLQTAQTEAPGQAALETAPLADTRTVQPTTTPGATDQPALIKVPSADGLAQPDAANAGPNAAGAEDGQQMIEAPSEDTVTARPKIGQPAGSLLDRDGAVTESRLPSIGANAEPAATKPALRADSPLIANAAKVDVPDDLPRMSVILIDDGTGPLGPEALEGFPFPVSFAISPSHPAARETAQAYRDLGFEVLAISDLPAGATASDIEVALAGTLQEVPQAVAVLEAPDGGFDSDRQTVTQVARYLAASGLGLVMTPRGLNTASQLAAREGVPSVMLFRDFDKDGQDARMIRRFLDQAAFRARQDGAVIMLGRLRADTISALVLWGLQDRASTVALVPASTVLLETLKE